MHRVHDVTWLHRNSDNLPKNNNTNSSATKVSEKKQPAAATAAKQQQQQSNEMASSSRQATASMRAASSRRAAKSRGASTSRGATSRTVKSRHDTKEVIGGWEFPPITIQMFCSYSELELDSLSRALQRIGERMKPLEDPMCPLLYIGEGKVILGGTPESARERREEMWNQYNTQLKAENRTRRKKGQLPQDKVRKHFFLERHWSGEEAVEAMRAECKVLGFFPVHVGIGDSLYNPSHSNALLYGLGGMLAPGDDAVGLWFEPREAPQTTLPQEIRDAARAFGLTQVALVQGGQRSNDRDCVVWTLRFAHAVEKYLTEKRIGELRRLVGQCTTFQV